MPGKKDDHLHGVLDDAGLRSKKTRQVRKYSVEDTLKVLLKEKNMEMDWGKSADREIW